MGALRVGDEVFDDRGEPTKVVAVSEVETLAAHRLRFDDGAEIVAADTHLWRTVDYHGRQPRGKHGQIPHWQHGVRTTQEIAETLHARGGHTVNHAIECCEPLVYPVAELPVDPWVLGYWLGNGARGTGGFTSGGKGDEEDTEYVVGQVEKAGYRYSLRKDQAANGGDKLGHHIGIYGLKVQLRALGVLTARRIPEQYLRASIGQRLALLQGLLDSDGYVEPTTSEKKRGNGAARVEWCGTHPVGEPNLFAEDVLDLLLGLGIKATARESDATLYGRIVSARIRIGFQTDLPVFGLPRKARALAPLRTRRAKTRYIVAAEPVEPVPCICIQVANADGMFLAGRECIPTHNSVLLRQWAFQLAAGCHWSSGQIIEPRTVLVIDAENSPKQIARSSTWPLEMARKYAEGSGGWDPRRLRVESMHRLDVVSNREQRDTIDRWLERYRPDLLVIGPLYKVGRNISTSHEDNAMGMTDVLDEWRERYGCAIAMEHHAPKATEGVRQMAPFGSSVWLRWPDIGLGVSFFAAREEIPEKGAHSTCSELLAHFHTSQFRGMRGAHQYPPMFVYGDRRLDQWQWHNGQFAKWADPSQDSF